MGPYSSTWLGSGVGIRCCSELQEELAPSSPSFWRVLGSVIRSRMKETPFDVILKTWKLIRGFGGGEREKWDSGRNSAYYTVKICVVPQYPPSVSILVLF